MDRIELFQVDAFTDKVFYGNPAAICLLNEWLNDELLKAIAVENNLSETAFVIEDGQGFHIRWFTPMGEIALSGHSTLAAGFLLFALHKCHGNSVTFSSLSGPLVVTRKSDRLTMDLPAFAVQPSQTPELLTRLVDKPCVEVLESELDYLIVLNHERDVTLAKVDLQALEKLPRRGLIVTAAAVDMDVYSRCFYPKLHIPEDHVTGSAYCTLAPYWAARMEKSSLLAVQGSVRKGELLCELANDRVFISAYCKWYSRGYLLI